MSPSGSRVVLSTCTGRTLDEQQTHFKVFDSREGTLQAEMTVDGECISRFSLQGDHRILSEHGRYVVVSEGYRPRNEIRVFDLGEERDASLYPAKKESTSTTSPSIMISADLWPWSRANSSSGASRPLPFFHGFLTLGFSH